MSAVAEQQVEFLLCLSSRRLPVGGLSARAGTGCVAPTPNMLADDVRQTQRTGSGVIAIGDLGPRAEDAPGRPAGRVHLQRRRPASASVAGLVDRLGFAPIELGKINEGGLLIQARGRTWGQLIFQDLAKFD